MIFRFLNINNVVNKKELRAINIRKYLLKFQFKLLSKGTWLQALSALPCSSYLITQDLNDEQEELDDVEVDNHGCEDVTVLVKLEPSVLAAHNHLGVVHQVDAVKEDAEARIGQVHLRARDYADEEGEGEYEGEDPEEAATHCEVALGGDGVAGQAEDHSSC